MYSTFTEETHAIVEHPQVAWRSDPDDAAPQGNTASAPQSLLVPDVDARTSGSVVGRRRGGGNGKGKSKHGSHGKEQQWETFEGVKEFLGNVQLDEVYE